MANTTAPTVGVSEDCVSPSDPSPPAAAAAASGSTQRHATPVAQWKEFELVILAAIDEAEIPWEVVRLSSMGLSPHPEMEGIREKRGENAALEWQERTHAYLGLTRPFDVTRPPLIKRRSASGVIEFVEVGSE